MSRLRLLSPDFKIGFVQAPQDSRRVSEQEYARNRAESAREYNKTVRSAYWGAAGIFIFMIMAYVLPNYIPTSPSYGSKDAGEIARTVVISLAAGLAYRAIVWVISYIGRNNRPYVIPPSVYGGSYKESDLKNDTLAVVLQVISKAVFWITVVAAVLLGIAALV